MFKKYDMTLIEINPLAVDNKDKGTAETILIHCTE
jgi:succinyl-CoA synthetase beta subunit